MRMGWKNNRYEHGLCAKGIRVRDSRKKLNGMPLHKNIGGVKFELKTDGIYRAKVKIDHVITEEEALLMAYTTGGDIKDLKFHIKLGTSGKLDDDFVEDKDRLEEELEDEGWLEISNQIDQQTKRNRKIIEGINK